MSRPIINQSVDAEVGADKRLAPKHNQLAVDERIQGLIEQVIEHGYVVIPNAFSDEEVRKAKAELERISKEKAALEKSQETGKSSMKSGRNTFEGLKTERIYSLANKSRVFDKFALHPDVLALNDHFLERGYLLNSFLSINIRPGEQPQTLHFDDGYITVPRPHHPFGAAIMVAIDPYTSDNGATVIVPDSHLWGADKIPNRSEAVPVVMPAGSMFYFLSTLWHGGGENTSSQDRVAMTVQYCQPWIRQLENQMVAVEWEKLGEMPPRLVDLLGYKVGAPFIGHVDGRSPRVAVDRMMREWQLKGSKGQKRSETRL